MKWGLFMLTDQYPLFLSFSEFYFILFYFIYSIFLSPHGVLILAFVFGCALGNDGSVDIRDEMCSNPSDSGYWKILEHADNLLRN